MAVDKLVDSTQLDADLTSVANAIRTKGGTSSQMAFPAGFVSAVQAIPTGITPTGTKAISITQNGTTTEDVTQYADAEITVNVSGGGGGLTLIDTITASAVNATKIDIDDSWFDTYTFVFIVPNLTFSQSDWLYCAMNATSNGQYYNASVSSMGENGTMTLRKLVTRSNKIGAAWYNTNNPGIVSFVNISYLYFYLYNASSTMTGEFKIYGVTI